jgi:MoxR-like ATPase
LFILRGQSVGDWYKLTWALYRLAFSPEHRLMIPSNPDAHRTSMKFNGTQNYIATQDLMLSVNAAITLQRPLLVKGEPGTGKTMLAEEVAQALGMPLLQWHIKSTTKAQQGLYEYDAVSRLRDSQMSDTDGGERVKNIQNYIVKGVLWQAFTADKPVALLIDEIDKADIEFPNDLLREIDRMEFYCYETRELIRATHRPLVFITSNNEKELPDAFCADASSTTSSSRTPAPCRALWMCTFQV